MDFETFDCKKQKLSLVKLSKSEFIEHIIEDYRIHGMLVLNIGFRSTRV